MTPASLLAALLSFSPPATAADEPAPSPAEAPAPQMQAANAEYQAALARVETAMQMANEDPASGSTQLRDALNLLQGFAPQLATNPEGQELRTMGQLTLARALLATNNADGAREAMDEAIRTSRGDPLPTKNFGPGLTALHRERAGVLEKQGAGSIEIVCNVPCRVFVNERPTQQRTDGLVPGSYRVWIEANDGSGANLQKLVAIESDGDAVKLEFGRAIETPPEEEDVPKPKPKKPRLLPRWADVLLLSAGAIAVGTGATLWAIDHKCGDLSNPRTSQCPEVFLTKTAGIVTVAGGGALLLTGTVLLTVDEIRVANQRGTQASLMWTFRF
ncbi:MAG TPA: hypothetical protein VM869_08180 [Enhygromyxa sp.]|nr:hypothetical protein [Enhygromyxa sp.]